MTHGAHIDVVPPLKPLRPDPPPLGNQQIRHPPLWTRPHSPSSLPQVPHIAVAQQATRSVHLLLQDVAREIEALLVGDLPGSVDPPLRLEIEHDVRVERPAAWEGVGDELLLNVVVAEGQLSS